MAKSLYRIWKLHLFEQRIALAGISGVHLRRYVTFGYPRLLSRHRSARENIRKCTDFGGFWIDEGKVAVDPFFVERPVHGSITPRIIYDDGLIDLRPRQGFQCVQCRQRKTS